MPLKQVAIVDRQYEIRGEIVHTETMILPHNALHFIHHVRVLEKKLSYKVGEILRVANRDIRFL